MVEALAADVTVQGEEPHVVGVCDSSDRILSVDFQDRDAIAFK